MAETSGTGQAAESVTLHLDLRVPGGRVQANLSAPTGPTTVRAFLPMAQTLTDKIVSLSVSAVEAAGRTVSCRAGCAACCRQLVPIGDAEARHLRDLVDALPEPRRSQVRQRFADAVRAVAGLFGATGRPDAGADDRSLALANDYFRLRIPCPFLEDESCSIYPDRPLACREYLVTSPAANCFDPHNDIVGVPLATSVSSAYTRFDPPGPGPDSAHWLPLIFALDRAASHPDEPPPRPGHQLLEEFITRVGRCEGRSLGLGGAGGEAPPPDNG